MSLLRETQQARLLLKMTILNLATGSGDNILIVRLIYQMLMLEAMLFLLFIHKTRTHRLS